MPIFIDDHHAKPLYVEVIKDGPSVCMLHIAPYSEEARSFKLMVEYAKSLG